MDHRRVLSLHHEDRLLDLKSLDFVGEHGKRIQSEGSLVMKSLRMNHARILISGQFVAASVNDDRLFELREHHDAANGRLRRRGQQPMIAPRVETNNGGRGKAAQPVSLEPFARSSFTK